MPTRMRWTEPVKTVRSSRVVRVVSCLVLLSLMVILPSAALAAVAGSGSDLSPAIPAAEVPDIQVAGGRSTEALAIPAAAVTTRPPAVTTRPVPVPAQPGNSTLYQAVKNFINRPRVLVPAGVFLLIVVIAVAGFLAFLYFLRKRRRSPGAPAEAAKALPGNPTIIDEPCVPAPVREETGGPAVPFPPPLEKRFRHPEFIGEGGIARVFRAQNSKTGMTVAVKVPVRFDEVTGNHFTRDIVLWQGLEHENIIRILSSNILPVPYIELEYAPVSLASVPLPLPEEKAIRVVLGIARGLAYAHDKGIVHRDIKPENILLSADDVPKITDWGLGKAISDTRQSSFIGFSPAYAAPEQIAPQRYGRPGPATDIYQTGMLLCELLTGAPAFRGEGMHDLNTSILEDTPVIPRWNGWHGDELEKIIRRCLQKKPEDRYASVADLIRELEEVQTAFA